MCCRVGYDHQKCKRGHTKQGCVLPASICARGSRGHTRFSGNNVVLAALVAVSRRKYLCCMLETPPFTRYHRGVITNLPLPQFFPVPALECDSHDWSSCGTACRFALESAVAQIPDSTRSSVTAQRCEWHHAARVVCLPTERWGDTSPRTLATARACSCTDAGMTIGY